MEISFDPGGIPLAGRMAPHRDVREVMRRHCRDRGGICLELVSGLRRMLVTAQQRAVLLPQHERTQNVLSSYGW